MNSRQTLDLLRTYESRNVTYIAPDGAWPIIWDRARGVWVWDADGRKYLDLTAAFGVAAAGHANPRVVRAGQRQMSRLLHAMGDVHPHALKAKLARELSRITFERWTLNSKPGAGFARSARTIFCNSGFEAVEAALKTALLATGKPGVIVFEGAYHGLGYGALNATHRDYFRGPFLRQLRRFGHFAAFPLNGRNDSDNRRHLDRAMASVEVLFRKHRHEIGAVLVEPVQVRGGVRIPPPEFLAFLRSSSTEHGSLLILDEIYTGMGRTGKWFACEHAEVTPDVICLGKALTGGFPLSACVGSADLMDAAWPQSPGEAIHTSTFLGHPVGCAMALAQIQEIRRLDLVSRSAWMGAFLLRSLRSALSGVSSRLDARFRAEVRGLGLLAGVDVRRRNGSPAGKETMRILERLLRRGFIALPEGEYGNVISFTPPLTIPRPQLERAVAAVVEELALFAHEPH